MLPTNSQWPGLRVAWSAQLDRALRPFTAKVKARVPVKPEFFFQVCLFTCSRISFISIFVTAAVHVMIYFICCIHLQNRLLLLFRRTCKCRPYDCTRNRSRSQNRHPGSGNVILSHFPGLESPWRYKDYVTDSGMSHKSLNWISAYILNFQWPTFS